MDAEGSRRLIYDVIRISVRSRGQGRVGPGKEEVLWTPQDLALIGVLTDHEVAERTGRTLNAVRVQRRLLGRPNPKYPHYRHLPWTPEQDAMALTLPTAEAAARTGHTFFAVKARRNKLRRLGVTPQA